MDVVLKEDSSFRQIITCIKELADSGEFIFNSDGISMLSTCRENVVLIDLILTKDAFDKYKLDSESRLAINFENFNNVLKLSKNAKIGLSCKSGINKVVIKLNEKVDKKIQFDMLLTTIEDSGLDRRKIEHDVEIYIDAVEFQKSIKDLSTFGKKYTISVDLSGCITISVIGDAGTGEITFTDKEVVYPKGDPIEFTGTFNIKYLNLFSKVGLSDEIVLKFGKGVPFCLEYNLKYGHVKFYLSEVSE